MTYFSMLHPNGFYVHNLTYTRERIDVPFESGVVSEAEPGPRTVDITSEGGRCWDDILHGLPGENYFYFSDRARIIIQESALSGIDFCPIDVRKANVSKAMQQKLMPMYWLGRITGHVKVVDIRNEDYHQYPFALDETGLKFIIKAPPGIHYSIFSFVGRPLLTEATPDFVEPAPMRGWTVLVSERVANAFKKAKLTGYKINPLRPGGFCRL